MSNQAEESNPSKLLVSARTFVPSSALPGGRDEYTWPAPYPSPIPPQSTAPPTDFVAAVGDYHPPGEYEASYPYVEYESSYPYGGADHRNTFFQSDYMSRARHPGYPTPAHPAASGFQSDLRYPSLHYWHIEPTPQLQSYHTGTCSASCQHLQYEPGQLINVEQHDHHIEYHAPPPQAHSPWDQPPQALSFDAHQMSSQLRRPTWQQEGAPPALSVVPLPLPPPPLRVFYGTMVQEPRTANSSNGVSHGFSMSPGDDQATDEDWNVRPSRHGFHETRYYMHLRRHPMNRWKTKSEAAWACGKPRN